MAAPIKDITSTFNAVVRETSFFRGWRKRGARRFWDDAERVNRAIELTLFKHSWENNQVVGVGVLFAFPTEVEPVGHGYGGVSADGKFVVTTYASPTEGMGVATFASDRAIHLHDDHDIEKLRALLPSLLSNVVIPFLQEHSDEQRLMDWYNREHPMPSSLPLVFAQYGRAAARRTLATWLSKCPQERGGDRLVRWLEQYEILGPALQKRFRSADMQAHDDYCREMREIANELLSDSA